MQGVFVTGRGTVRMLFLIACYAVLLCLPVVKGAAQTLTQAQLQPFWQGKLVDREPVLFVVDRGASSATAHLLFHPSVVVRVTSGDGLISYEEGKDFQWNKEESVLTLLPGSRIPHKSWSELHPPLGSPAALDSGDGRSAVFFAEGGRVFQSLQVNVTYRHDDLWQGTKATNSTEYLRRTVQKLRTGQPVKIITLGDSISEGACASATFGGIPHQSPYAVLVAEALREEYGDKVDFTNLSVGGTNSAWGASMATTVAGAKPDLVILAFGMNDASQLVPAASYGEHIRLMISTIRGAQPDADIILVASMLGNSEWIPGAMPFFAQYQKALYQFEGPGTAVADLTTVWSEMLERKRFLDLTGNGVNHPNDFGHRVYAEVILQLFH